MIGIDHDKAVDRHPEEAVAPAVSLTCREMPELIVRHLIRHLPGDLCGAVEAHLAGCPGCMRRRQALGIAAAIHDGRRRAEAADGPRKAGR